MLNTFLFTDPEGKDDVYCLTTIFIEEETVNNTEYYIVKLTSFYQDGKQVKNFNDVMAHSSHPLSVKSKIPSVIPSYFDGFTVIKNSMTHQMLDFLIKDNNELSKETGTITPQSYRREILCSLINFAE